MQILDHGYIKFVDKMGTDASIIEAARMSTDKGFLGWGPLEDMEDCKICLGTTRRTFHGSDGEPVMETECTNSHCINGKVHKQGDEKLLAYLYEEKHATPFEFCQLVIEVKAPIFVFREWQRHRTQSYNEMSSRYTPLPNENYIPTVERLMMNAGGSNRQAGTIKGAKLLDTKHKAEWVQTWLAKAYGGQQLLYDDLLLHGVPKELARIHLPVGRYSKMRASANLRNWLAFLTLRQAPAAQWEIRQYANAVSDIIKAEYPRTHELFVGDPK